VPDLHRPRPTVQLQQSVVGTSSPKVTMTASMEQLFSRESRTKEDSQDQRSMCDHIVSPVSPAQRIKADMYIHRNLSPLPASQVVKVPRNDASGGSTQSWNRPTPVGHTDVLAYDNQCSKKSPQDVNCEDEDTIGLFLQGTWSKTQPLACSRLMEDTKSSDNKSSTQGTKQRSYNIAQTNNHVQPPLVPKFTVSEMLVRELFHEVDIDRTGRIDECELAMLLRKFSRSCKGLSEEKRKNLERRDELLESARWCIASFGTVDPDTVNWIDATSTVSALTKLFEEQTAVHNPGANQVLHNMVSMQEESDVTEVLTMFDAIDTDGCGYIDHEELECLLLKMGRKINVHFSRAQLTYQAEQIIKRFGDAWITPRRFYFADFIKMLLVEPWNVLLPPHVRASSSPIRVLTDAANSVKLQTR